jgi:hypothetical protein
VIYSCGDLIPRSAAIALGAPAYTDLPPALCRLQLQPVIGAIPQLHCCGEACTRKPGLLIWLGCLRRLAARPLPSECRCLSSYHTVNMAQPLEDVYCTVSSYQRLETRTNVLQLLMSDSYLPGKYKISRTLLTPGGFMLQGGVSLSNLADHHQVLLSSRILCAMQAPRRGSPSSLRWTPYRPIRLPS